MAALKHDAKGYLSGDPIDIGRALAVWDDIRSDVRAIRKAVMGASEAAVKGGWKHADASRVIAQRGGMEEADPAVKAAPRSRERAASAIPARRYSDEIPALLRKAVMPVRGQGNEVASTSAKPGASGAITRPERKSPQSVAKPAGRDGRGRFTKGDGRPDGLLPNDAADDADTGALRSIADRIVGAVAESSSGMEEADPAIKAFNEVAQPMARGYGMLTGGSEDKKQTGFLRRIFSTLNVFRKEETAYSKAANKSLKALEGRPDAQGGGDDGFLGTLLGLFPKLALIPALIAAGIAGWNLGQWVGNKIYEWMSESGINDAIFNAVDTVKDGWSKVVSKWDSVIATIASTWEGALEKLSSVWNGVKDAGKHAFNWASEKATAANNFIKDKTGVDVKGTATAAKDKALKAAGAAVVAEKTSAVAERAYNVTAATAGSALETVMPKGYRHKALFDGIKGGDSLTKYGSYTDEEAAKIRELKTSGANTTANVKGGMSTEIQDKISAQAKKAGLDPVMMQKIAAMESGGNANAISSTGAAGIYQFTGQTASGVGIKNRFDVDQNIEGGMKLTKQNQAALKKAGLPVSAENLYMMHQLGPKAAQEVIRGAADGKSKDDMSPETQKAMNLNYGANSKTAADYLATNKKALDDRYASVTKDSGGSQVAIAKAISQQPTHETTQPTKLASAKTKSIADDPTQGGRYSYKDIGNNQLSVTDKETGISELASDEQARAYRINEGKAYKDQLAQANDPNSYRPGGALSNSQASKASRLEPMDFDKSKPSYQGMPMAPAVPVVASISAPPVSVAPTIPPIAEAPSVAIPMASADTKKPAAVSAPVQEAGQDLKDRRIAHIVTGGLSSA